MSNNPVIRCKRGCEAFHCHLGNDNRSNAPLVRGSHLRDKSSEGGRGHSVPYGMPADDMGQSVRLTGCSLNLKRSSV